MQRRFVALNDRLGTFTLLQVIFQRRLFHRQRRLRLMNALFVDPVINLEQHLAWLDVGEILDINGSHIAADLRTDKGGLPANIGVIGKLAVGG